MPLPGGFSLRPAGSDDVEFWCRLRSTDPRLAVDPVVMRDRWDESPAGVLRERSVIQEGGIPIGILGIWRPRREDAGQQFVDVGVDFLDGHDAAELRDAAWDVAEDRARELGAEVITTRCLDHEAAHRAYLAERGYLLDRAGIISGLDIGASRERFLAMAAEAEAKLRAAGIELTTLDRVDDRYRELYEVFVEALSDIPTTAPIVPESFEQFVKMLRKPWVGEGRVWIAVADGRPVGMSWLGHYPTTGNVFTEMTGVARAGRGQGIARALKLQTIAQALDSGVHLILTENDADNVPILKINRAFGYQPLREALWLRKPA
ncbi:MAG TPA: GNAT family N-acetyltransferase [Candidatus Dormibacteraeota bacterium]|jgi:GNAT superfamily N-acetyltransferase